MGQRYVAGEAEGQGAGLLQTLRGHPERCGPKKERLMNSGRIVRWCRLGWIL